MNDFMLGQPELPNTPVRRFLKGNPCDSPSWVSIETPGDKLSHDGATFGTEPLSFERLMHQPKVIGR